eukprot:scaffold9731_cov113-Isochrysis_galbana.AAC.3
MGGTSKRARPCPRGVRSSGGGGGVGGGGGALALDDLLKPGNQLNRSGAGNVAVPAVARSCCCPVVIEATPGLPSWTVGAPRLVAGPFSTKTSESPNSSVASLRANVSLPSLFSLVSALSPRSTSWLCSGRKQQSPSGSSISLRDDVAQPALDLTLLTASSS